jgi:Uncharacterized conserved protein
MLQQAVALAVIAWFLFRLFMEKRSQKISRHEFIVWSLIWVLAGAGIVFIRQIDTLISGLGFSASGIEILQYIAIIFLVYLIFKMRLRQERLDKEITRIVRELALRRNNK